MVAPVSASGASVISLFGSRPSPAARPAARGEAPFRPDEAQADRPVDAARAGRSAVGSPPRGLLSFETAASLQAGQELTPEEQAQVRDLKARDAEVRAHERAHAAVGGQYAGSPSYQYQRGPDGKDHAVGGEVPIDASPLSGDPKGTIEKMEIVKAAALAPAEPSAQDRKVAASADAERRKAVRELQAERAEAVGQADSAEPTGFAAFTMSDFRRVDRPTAAAATTVPEPVAQRPTRPGRPTVLDISV